MLIHRWKIPDEVIEKGFEIVLKTPALFIIDFWDQVLMKSKWNGYDGIVDKIIPDGYTFVVKAAMPAFALFVLVTELRTVLRIYVHVMALGILAVCQSVAKDHVAKATGDSGEKLTCGPLELTLIYLVASAALSWVCDFKHPVMKWFPMAFLLPVLVRLWTPEVDAVRRAFFISQHLVRCTVIIGFIVEETMKVVIGFYELAHFCNDYIERVGFSDSVYDFCIGIIDEKHFFLAWIAIFLKNVWSTMGSVEFQDFQWNHYFVALLGLGCYSNITLMMTCIAIMYMSQGILHIAWLYLLTCKIHARPVYVILSGYFQGFMMFFMALESRVTDLEYEERFTAMYMCLHVVVVALNINLLDLVHPVLLAVAPMRKVSNHVKVLGMVTVIFSTACYMGWVFREGLETWDTWPLLMFFINVLTTIQVIEHLIHYLIYLCDSRMEEPLESQDDISFYIRSFVATFEVLSAIFVIGLGIRDASNLELTPTGFFVLCCHFYNNVYIRIKLGWKLFLIRFCAAKRVESMAIATPEELRQHNDMCSICHMDMLANAKITPCDHYFHERCLKKWLSLHTNCPLCQTDIINIRDEAERQRNVIEEEIIVEEDNNEENLERSRF